MTAIERASRKESMNDSKESRVFISIKDGKMDITVDVEVDANTMPLMKMLLEFKGEYYPDDDLGELLKLPKVVDRV